MSAKFERDDAFIYQFIIFIFLYIFVMFICKKADQYKIQILVPLWVLMWKYSVARLYKYCHTLWEIFGGTSVFLILFLVDQTALTISSRHATRRLADSDNVTTVFYTPYNNFTKNLMTKVENYLIMNNETDVPYHWQFAKVVQCLKDEQLLANASDNVALVDFKDNLTFATNLEYTIKMKREEIPSHMDGVYSGFLRSLVPKVEIAPPFLGVLQWAIDKSYIEQLTNKDIDQLVTLKAKPKYITEELRTLHKFMIVCTILAPLPFFLLHSSRLIVERRSGLRELMKLNGVCSDVLRFSHVLETTIVGILYAIPVIILLKITSTPLLPYSNWFIIYFTIVLHFVNTTCLAFVTTALSQDFHHADCLGLLMYLSTFILDFIWYNNKHYTPIVYVVCILFPHAPVYLFWDEVLYLETIGEGVNFSNLSERHIHPSISVLRVWMFFYIQLTVTTTIAWYLDLVRPGPYGVSKKWNFLFTKKYWCFKRKRTLKFEDEVDTTKRDAQFFEKGPRKAEVAIKALHVTKVFKTLGGRPGVTALDSVSFSCYQGEVTMLLGANGSGKSTLLSIVAGMFSATDGKVYVNGMDVTHKVMELREDVGLCMQNNVCFEYLTVRENITFFYKLRKQAPGALTVDQLMKKLKLTDVADSYKKQMNTGMLRCLQVACTLAGGAKVLVLDEPTSCMDIEIRHRLWDLIMVLRGTKTILMATSFLEEAIALGDRIVILNNGILKCHGTPMFLKQAIGSSCNLTISIRDSTQMKSLKEMVDNIIPDLNSRVQDIKHITFSLPSKDALKFPELFKALEDRKEQFGITLMDVGMFMEEVFLKFIEPGADGNEGRRSVSYRNLNMEKAVGMKLVLKQVRLLTRRVYQYFMMKKYQFFTMRVFAPIFGILMMTLVTNHALRQDTIFSHHISRFEQDEIKSLVYNVGPFRRRGVFNIVDRYPAVTPVYALDIDTAFSKPSSGYMSEETMGIKMADNYSTIFHPLDPSLASKSINLYSNIHLLTYMPQLNRSIRTTYEPLARRKNSRYIEPKSVFLCLKWASWVMFLSVLPLTPLIILCIDERKSGTRDTHIIAGCSPIVFWASKLIAHMAIYSAVIIAPVLIFAILLDFDSTFRQFRFLGSLFAILLVFGPAFLVHLYFLSFYLNVTLAICQVYITSIFFGIILPILVSVLEPLWHSSVFIAVPYFVLLVVGRVSPQFALGIGLARLAVQARMNAICSLNRNQCPEIDSNDLFFSSRICCESDSSEPFGYLNASNNGLSEIINLILHFIVYGALVILLEMKIPQYLYEMFSLSNYKPPQQAFHDANVRKEKNHVRSVKRGRKYEDGTLLVDDLHKEYANQLRAKHTLNAVRGVTFTVQPGECFAILGPQATGKSSVLNMVAGSRIMTRGDARIGQHTVRKHRLKYLHKISLMSTLSGLDSFMTGHQNLVFIAKLKGYSEDMACKLSLMALHYMGLQDNETIVSNLSAGCVRRLSLCGTLVLAPQVALLDEPMRYLDSSSKPLVAKALQRLILEPTAVVLAETSVDWRHMQSVFTRIAIMSKGQFATLGPAEEVLASVAKGFTARIKIKMVTAYREDRFRIITDRESSSSEDSVDIPLRSSKSRLYANDINEFKKDFLAAFESSRLTAEHLCMLYFYIEDENKTMLYSEMFKKLEELKEKYSDVVVDYTLSATTVEDVFWRLEYEKQRALEERMINPNLPASRQQT